MTQVLGAIVIARNGQRWGYYQDPKTYKGSFTETTALGEVQSHQLGMLLRKTYLDSSSASYIEGIRSDLVDNKEVKVRVKAGGEGTVVFDSAIALLQGLFPPNERNSIVLANETTIVAPLNGYQYVPVETVEPENDRELESWTNCPAFEKHVAKFYSSDKFKKMEAEAEPFFGRIKDFVFGRPTTLENIWNIYDFMSSQLMYNKTYAHRLPPNLVEHAHALANFHECGVFSEDEPTGVGNIAGRTLLHTVLSTLERLAFEGDPLQFMLIETTYHPFISLFHQLGIVKEHPELATIPDFASALVIELRRGQPPDLRDFLRFQFRNGPAGSLETLHVFGHHSDIPVTEFIYRADGYAISNNKEWATACNAKSATSNLIDGATSAATENPFSFIAAFVLLFGLGLFLVSRAVKMRREKVKRRGVRLEGEEEHLCVQKPDEKGAVPVV